MVVFGAVPTVLSITMSSLLRNVGCSKQAGFGLSMGGVLNILLDPLLMFVLLPRGYEIIGAGLATALSNLISSLYFAITIYHLHSPVLSFSIVELFPSRESIRVFLPLV